MPNEPVAFGPFSFRPDKGTLFRDGELVAIGQRGALLLKALLDSPGEVVTKAELMEAVWPGTAVEESNLSVQIASLRKHLGPSPDGEWIATIPRVGYRFIGDAKAPAASQTPATHAETFVPALALLPFQNLSGDPEQAYFADGVVEDIITALSRFKSFAVIARNSSFVYRNHDVDIRQAAEELGVRYILKGTIRRAGDRLRIAAQLIEGASRKHLWAQSFDGTLRDLFDFQDSIAGSVAAVVEPQIQLAEIKRAQRKPPESVAAYDLRLQALPKIYAETPEAAEEAYRLLTSALALEPDNGPILAHAAWTLGLRQTRGWPSITENDTSRSVELARRAMDHAEGDARVMVLAAIVILHTTKDNNLAMELVRAAADTNPYDLMVVTQAGSVHLHAGDVEEAIALFLRAVRLSPIDPTAHYPLTGLAVVSDQVVPSRA